MLLVDTNVLSELRKVRAGKGDANVAGWIDGASIRTLFLSVISIMEIEIGIRLLDRRDKAQATMLRRWLEDQLVPSFADRMLGVDFAVARRCAALHVPDPKPHLDALIAATALVHGLTVATRNVSHFETMGVTVLNPWEAV